MIMRRTQPVLRTQPVRGQPQRFRPQPGLPGNITRRTLPVKTQPVRGQPQLLRIQPVLRPQPRLPGPGPGRRPPSRPGIFPTVICNKCGKNRRSCVCRRPDGEFKIPWPKPGQPGQPRDPEREQDFKDSREAIEAAYQAGIMGDEEYHQRMTEGREGIEAQFQDLMRRTTERGHGRVNIGALRGELRDMEMGRIGELARDRRAIDIERAERAWEPARWKAGALPRLFEQFPRWPEEEQPGQPAPERERPRIQPWLEREEQRKQEKERRSQWRKEFVRQMQERSSSLTPLEKKAIQRHYGFPIFRTRPRKPRSRFSDGLRRRPRTYLRRIRITPGPGSIRRREKVERVREQIRRRQERNLRRR